MSTDPGEQRKNRITVAAGTALVLAALLVLFLYLQQQGDEPTEASQTSTPTVQSTPSETPTDSPSEDPEDERGDLPGQDEIEEASKESAQARKVAAKVIDQMAKTDLSTQKWRAGLNPLFTKNGQTQVAAMTPKSVKFTKRSGPANLVLTEVPSSGQFPIAVDTDKGMWMVMVVQDDDDKWRAMSVSEYTQGPLPEAPA